MTKQYFESVEQLYNVRLNYLISFASRHIYNRDFAIDAVHDALAKAVEYFAKHEDRKVQLQIIEWLIIKSCKKLNKYSNEIPTDFSVVEQEE